jgi:hypothetical protein
VLQRANVVVIVIAFRPSPPLYFYSSGGEATVAITIGREQLILYHRLTAVHCDIGGVGDGIDPNGDICHYSFSFLNVARSSVL